jgi:3-deoxy-7-phosphoheptulonate synthase
MAIPFKEALQRLENRRVKSTRPLIPPQILQEDLPLCVSFTLIIPPLTLTSMSRSLGAAQTVLEGRKATEEIFRGADDRLIVVVGYVVLVGSLAPCLKIFFHQALFRPRC